MLQGSVHEEDRTLALHNALVVAKIVRIDYPAEWPDVLPTIISVTRSTKSGNPMHLNGALQVLLRVVKELATARLRKSQTALQAVTPELVQLLGEIYTEKTALWLGFLTKGNGGDEEADYATQNSLTALRILRRLVIAGYEHPHTDAMVQGLWSMSQSQFDQFLGGVAQDSWVPSRYQDIVGKHLIQFTKLHINMCESHPASFPVLPNSISLVKAYWNLIKSFSPTFERSQGIRQASSGSADGKNKHEGPLSETIALKGLILLRSCVAIAYRPVQTFKYRSQETKDQEQAAVDIIKGQLLTEDLLLDIVCVTISSLFVFRQSDLEAWEADPEEWESQERSQGSAYEWAVRPCAERLLIDLLTKYKHLASPLLTYCELATKVDMDIVAKEAAYCALGCAASVVYEAFDFDRFLTTTLVKDAQVQDPMAKILRRRIPILLSQWVSVKISQDNRPIVYDIFRHLMNPKDEYNDEVVRITAAREFMAIADDFDFVGEAFLPYAADMFNSLINLLQEVSTDETKLSILGTIRVIVSRMDTHIAPFGDAIMSVIPSLWESAGTEEYMIKQSVLSIVAALVMSMRDASKRYQSSIMPLLREALDPESALHVHLIEESVELWRSVLMQSSPPLEMELVQLVVLALPLLEYDSEVANQCLEIVKAYIVLAPRMLLSDELRRPTLVALGKTLDSRSREQAQLGAKSVELLVRTAHELGSEAGLSTIVHDMLETGLLGSILEGLFSAWESSQMTGPTKKAAKINTIKQTDYLALLARIALADPGVFARMLGSFGFGGGGDNAVQSVFGWLSTLWFASFDSMSDIERQKLSCLALTRLCELQEPVQSLVLAKLQDYLSMWTAVVTQLRCDDGAEGAAAAPQGDSLVWTEVPHYEYEMPVDTQEAELTARDPVHVVDTYEFVQLRLRDLVQRAGGEAAFQTNWAVNVDQDVLAGFQGLGA